MALIDELVALAGAPAHGRRPHRLHDGDPTVGELLAGADRRVRRLEAHGRHVRRGKRTLVTAWVSSRAGRKGEPLKPSRDRVHVATKRLDRACVVRCRPRITRRSNFRARIAEDDAYLSGTSRALRIKWAHHKRHRHHLPRSSH